MEMDNAIINSLNELVSLQRQQNQRMDDLVMQQAEQVNIQRQQATNSETNTNSNMKIGAKYGYSSYSTPTNPIQSPTYSPFSAVQQQAEQFSNYAKNLNGKGAGYGYMDSLHPGLGVSREARNLIVQDYAGRSSSAAISGVGTVASGIASFAPYSMGLGFLGATVASVGAGAVVGSIFDNAAEQAKIQNAYSKYLQRESYRFINSSESNNNRGLAGFSIKESQQAADWLRTKNSDFYLKDTEMMQMLSNFTESGMLRDVQDLESFKNKMTNLTKTVRTGASLLNETYQSISDLMAEMKKMGISEGDYSNLMSMGKVVGSSLGISGSESIRNILSIAGGMVSGTGLSATQYAERTADTSIYMSSLYDTLKASTDRNEKQSAVLNYIANNGGVSAASGMLNQMQDSILDKYNIAAAGFYTYDEKTRTWKFSPEKYKQMMSGNFSLAELNYFGENTLNSAGNMAVLDWQDNYKTYIGNSLNEREIAKFTKALTYGANVEIGNPSLDDTNAGLQIIMNELSPDQRLLLSAYTDTTVEEGSAILNKSHMLSMMEELRARNASNRKSIWGELGKGWEGFKDTVGGFGARVGDAFGNAFRNIEDYIYKNEYIDTSIVSNTKWTVNDINNMVDKLAITLSNAGTGRSVYTNGERLFGETYDSISSISKSEKLSETILGALVKFSETETGKKMLGGALTSDSDLESVSHRINKLLEKYGGNEELALKALFNNEESIDAQLKASGYDITSARNDGSVTELKNKNFSNIISGNNYEEFEKIKTQYSDNSLLSKMTNEVNREQMRTNAVGMVGSQILNPTITEAYLKYAQSNISLLEEDQYNLLSAFAKNAGLSKNSVSDLKSDRKNLEAAYEAMQSWYNTQYNEIERSANGYDSEWDRLTIASKSNTLQMMKLLQNSSFGGISSGQYKSHGSKDMIDYVLDQNVGGLGINIKNMDALSKDALFTEQDRKDMGYKDDSDKDIISEAERYARGDFKLFSNGLLDEEFIDMDFDDLKSYVNDRLKEGTRSHLEYLGKQQDMVSALQDYLSGKGGNKEFSSLSKEDSEGLMDAYKNNNINRYALYLKDKYANKNDQNLMDSLDKIAYTGNTVWRQKMSPVYDALNEIEGAAKDIDAVNNTVLELLGYEGSAAKAFKNGTYFDFFSQDGYKDETVGDVTEKLKSSFNYTVSTIANELQMNPELFAAKWNDKFATNFYEDPDFGDYIKNGSLDKESMDADVTKYTKLSELVVQKLAGTQKEITDSENAANGAKDENGATAKEIGDNIAGALKTMSDTLDPAIGELKQTVTSVAETTKNLKTDVEFMMAHASIPSSAY